MSRRLTWRDACRAIANTADSLPWRQSTEPAHHGSTFEQKVSISARKSSAQPSESSWCWSDFVISVLLVLVIAAVCFGVAP